MFSGQFPGGAGDGGELVITLGGGENTLQGQTRETGGDPKSLWDERPPVCVGSCLEGQDGVWGVGCSCSEVLLLTALRAALCPVPRRPTALAALLTEPNDFILMGGIQCRGTGD